MSQLVITKMLNFHQFTALLYLQDMKVIHCNYHKQILILRIRQDGYSKLKALKKIETISFEWVAVQ